MLKISRVLEDKEYDHRSYSRDPAETEFLRRREGDLLFRHGLGYDSSRDLDCAKVQAEKSLELVQRQMKLERQHMNQKELSL